MNVIKELLGYVAIFLIVSGVVRMLTKNLWK